MNSQITLHLKEINDRVQSLNKDIVTAHEAISRSNYCNLNGDVTILESGVGRITSTLADILKILRKDGSDGIKTNGLEYYNASLYKLSAFIKDLLNSDLISHVTLHVFESKYNTESFPLHTDPADVILCMLEGSKVMDIDNGNCIVSETITVDNPLYIPMNIPHKALNHENNIMLSIGIERYTTEHIEREG